MPTHAPGGSELGRRRRGAEGQGRGLAPRYPSDRSNHRSRAKVNIGSFDEKKRPGLFESVVFDYGATYGRVRDSLAESPKRLIDGVCPSGYRRCRCRTRPRSRRTWYFSATCRVHQPRSRRALLRARGRRPARGGPRVRPTPPLGCRRRHSVGAVVLGGEDELELKAMEKKGKDGEALVSAGGGRCKRGRA